MSGPPFPAYRGTFSAAGYTSATPRYGHPLALNAEGLVFTNGGYLSALPGYARGSPGLPNAAAFHGAPPGHPYAAGFNGALPRLPSAAAFHDAPPGHAHAAGFNGALPGHAYAPRGLNPRARSFESRDSDGLNPDASSFLGGLNPGARSFLGGLNPAARSFERHDTGSIDHVAGHEARQDVGGALNSGARSLERYDSGAHQRGLSFHPGQLSGGHRIAPKSGSRPVARHDADAPSCSRAHQFPGRNPFSASSEDTPVRQIWRYNCSEVFQEIRQLIVKREGLLYIGIDIEYLADATTKTKFKPFTPDNWYTSLEEYVNNGTVLQIGLAFTFEEGDSEILAYELNLAVDVEQGNFHKDAVKFLEDHNHDFSKHKELGILPEWISAGLLQYLPFGSDSVVWIAYHGDRDLAFILRLLEGGGIGVRLPSSFCSFCHQLNRNFPLYYDVKVLAQMVEKGYQGKLTTLTGDQYLKLKRMGGEHHAGSDALLTLQCFWEIVQRYNINGILARKGLLSGVEDLQLPITCYRHVTATDVNVVDVYHANFDHESAYISQAIASNFNRIGLQIAAPQDLHAIKRDYKTLKCAVGEVDSFELLLCFMNSEGNLAFGRAWKFFLKVQARDETSVNPQRLSALLASSRTTHNENAVWVMYGVEYGLACLMRSFVSPGDLPPSSVRYKLAQSNLFPHVFDVKVMAESYGELEFGGDIRETASQLGVVVDPCDVITLLRCFYLCTEGQSHKE